jgi:cytoskeletal protein CcmA (bactofilin family)
MAIFGRKKDEAVSSAGSQTPPSGRDTDVAVPSRSASTSNPPSPLPAGPKENIMSQSMKPATAPAANALAQRSMSPAAAGVGVPARPQQTPPMPSDRRTLTVGKGISVQGTLADCERLVVEGTVESEMLLAAELSIGHTGIFRGEVQVEDAEVGGLFDGTLTARGNLVIRSTGKVNGIARCKRLTVEDGGQLTGRMEMLTEDAIPTAPAAPAPAPSRPAPVV